MMMACSLTLPPETNRPVCRGGEHLPGGGADVGLRLIGHVSSWGSVAYL